MAGAIFQNNPSAKYASFNKKLLSVLIMLIGCFGCSHYQSGFARVCFYDTCVQAKISATESEKRQGLMYVKGLSQNEGMLFVFKEEGRHGFWMKNMNFPLDIIWLDKEKKISDIKENLAPCRDDCQVFLPQCGDQYVLEVNSGFAQKHRLKIGDKATLSF